MSATSARRAARRVVSRVRERSAYAHEVLDAALAEAGLDARDAAFATRLAYGTVQTRGTLDEALARHLDRPSRVEPQVLDALAVAAYELLFARTPARAAVNDGVELVREVRPQAAGLANAVLRRLSEDAATFPWGDPEDDLDALARLYGHPTWLAQLLIDELGRESAVGMMRADNEPAPLYLAVNPFTGSIAETTERLAAEGAEPRVCLVPGCVRADAPGPAVRSEVVAGGQALITDAAAQLVARIAAPPAGGIAVDVGAGRGTKTALLQAIAVQRGEAARIIGVEIHAFKADILRERMAKLGVPGVEVVVADASDPEALLAAIGESTADVVLVDAPCSGLGTLRRHPEARWRVRPADIEALAALGSKLLKASARLVRPGGFVVYSTCTVTRRENSDVIEGFLKGARGFRLDDLEADIPTEWQRFVRADGTFLSIPEPDGPDGHFAARIVRE